MTVAEGLALQVLTPAETIVSAESVSIVRARLTDGGWIGILPRHAPLIAETVAGDLRYRDAGGEHTVCLAAGILHVEQDCVTVLTSGYAQQDAEAGNTSETEMRFDRLAEALLNRGNSNLETGPPGGAAGDDA